MPFTREWGKPGTVVGGFEGTDLQVLKMLREEEPRSIMARLKVAMTHQMTLLQQYIVSEKLQGQVLRHLSGTLANSIRVIPMEERGTVVIGGVRGAGGPAFYGVYFEKGGKRWYDIYPKNKKALAFFGSEGMVPRNASVLASVTRGFASQNVSIRAKAISKFGDLGGIVVKHVHHPPIPKLPFMAPSLEERKDSIIEALRQAVRPPTMVVPPSERY
jgi:hypothetical protein